MVVKSPKKLTERLNVQSYLLSAVIFLPLVIVWMVFITKSHTADNNILNYVSLHITPFRTSFMKAVSFLGAHRFLVPANLLLILLLLIYKKKKVALVTLLVSLSSLGLMSSLKNLFQRIRPPAPLVEGITNYSFPSGHAMMSITFYGFVIWLVKCHITTKWLRRSLITFLILLMLLIGFSRIYLRVHYPTDVIAGYCIGIAWLWLCLRVTRSYRKESAALL